MVENMEDRVGRVVVKRADLLAWFEEVRCFCRGPNPKACILLSTQEWEISMEGFWCQRTALYNVFKCWGPGVSAF